MPGPKGAPTGETEENLDESDIDDPTQRRTGSGNYATGTGRRFQRDIDDAAAMEKPTGFNRQFRAAQHFPASSPTSSIPPHSPGSISGFVKQEMCEALGETPIIPEHSFFFIDEEGGNDGILTPLPPPVVPVLGTTPSERAREIGPLPCYEETPHLPPEEDTDPQNPFRSPSSSTLRAVKATISSTPPPNTFEIIDPNPISIFIVKTALEKDTGAGDIYIDENGKPHQVIGVIASFMLRAQLEKSPKMGEVQAVLAHLPGRETQYCYIPHRNEELPKQK